MLPLSVRLSLTMALVLLVSAVVTASLNYLKFQQVMGELERSRYAFLASDLKDSIEGGLNLGLPLDQIDAAAAIVARHRALDPGIAAIDVFDRTGDVIYRSAATAGPWLDAALAQRRFQGPDISKQLSAAPLVGSFGDAVGGVLIRYSETGATARSRVIVRELAVAVAAAVVVGLAILVVGATMLLRGVRGRLTEIASDLQLGAEDSEDWDRLVETARSSTAAQHEFGNAAAAALRDLKSAEMLLDLARDHR